jgi:hypothetical protein
MLYRHVRIEWEQSIQHDKKEKKIKNMLANANNNKKNSNEFNHSSRNNNNNSINNKKSKNIKI